MNKEALVDGLECAHREIITQLDQVEHPQNWRTNGDKVAVSLKLTAEEAAILAKLAELKQSYPHLRGALDCLREANGYVNKDLVVDISRQALVATLRYPKYVDDLADSDSDLGKFDTAFNRFSTFVQSAAKIARVKLGLD